VQIEVEDLGGPWQPGQPLGSTVERGFWAVDGMMVQVSGFPLAANRRSS
jgi:hypothetical protein